MALDQLGTALGTAVLHFLWQGSLIAVLASALLRMPSGATPGRRHLISYSALLLCLLCFLGTWAWGLQAPTGARMPLGSPEAEVVLGRGARTSWPLVAAWLWATGAAVMLLRFTLAWRTTRRLRGMGTFAVDELWQRTFDSLRIELGIRRGVRLLGSSLAQVPMVVGSLSPVVLVPACALTGLAPDQVRALLAHELAHVRRLDPVWNFIQALIEILLFFHPAIWWLSRQVRIEREYCCDDASIQLTGDPRVLAEALAAMETLRFQQPLASQILASQGGSLMNRILRILGAGSGQSSPSSAGWQLPAGLLAGGVLAVCATAAGTSAEGSERLQAVVVQKKAAVSEKQQTRPGIDELKAELAAKVKAGSMTQAEADRHLKGYMVRMEKAKAPQAGQRFQEALRKYEAALAAGELTPEEAKEKIEGLRMRIAKSKDAAQQTESPEATIERITKAVESGEITPAEGRAKLEAVRAGMAKAQAEREQKLAGVKARIDAAIQRGDITPAQGEARMKAFEQSLLEQSSREKSGPSEYEAAKARIQAAVASGKMTREEADRYMAGIEARAEKAKVQQASGRVEIAIERIKAAAEAGEISEEDAKLRIQQMKARVQAGKDKQAAGSTQQDAARREIREAVSKGKLTRQEAGEKLRQLEEAVQEKKVQEQRAQRTKKAAGQKSKVRREDGGQ